MNFFRNLTVRTRLFILLVLPLFALLYITSYVVSEKTTLIHDMEEIDSLSSLAVRVSALVHETQKERGATAGFLGSRGNKFSNELAAQRKDTDKKFGELKVFLTSFDQAHHGEGFQHSLSKAMGKLKELGNKRKAIDGLNIAIGDAIEYYTNINAIFLDLIAQTSKLSTNAELSNIIIAYVNFLKGKERAGVERAVLSNTFAADIFSPGMYDKFLTLLADQNTYMSTFLSYATDHAKSTYKTTMTGKPVEEVERMRAIAREKAMEGDFGIGAVYWFNTITAKINLLKAAEDKLSEELKSKSSRLREEAFASLVQFAAIAGAILLIVIIMALIITSSITAPIIRLRKAMSQVAAGHITEDLKVDSGGEIGVLIQSFNSLMNHLRDMINNLSSAAEMISRSTTQIADAAEQVATGSEEQSTQTDRVAASVEEMSATILDVAKNSTSASEAAAEATRVAKDGGSIVSETVEGMGRIATSVRTSAKTIEALGESSHQIGEIIAVINDIADQTNLLALNAAIEAARAGEQGRGFAVVADEVRKLAERTTRATKEIEVMIKNIQTETEGAVLAMAEGTEEVENGLQLSEKAGNALNEIVAVIENVNQLIARIATAAEEQSAAAEEISYNVESVATVTRQTSAMARRSSESTIDLTTLANSLKMIVDEFKVNGKNG